YTAGATVWRAPLPHFSKWDVNWGFSPPSDAVMTSAAQVVSNVTADCGRKVGGARIDDLAQTAAESVAVAGTPYQLVYQSDRTASRFTNDVQIPLSGPTVPASLKRIDLDVTVGARTFHQEFPPAPNLSTEFTWDGLDAF